MSDSSDQEDVMDAFRRSNDRFQQRLQEAQQTVVDKQIEADLEQSARDNNDELLDEERALLQARVERAEAEVAALAKEIADRKSRRDREATLTKMTAEERATAVHADEADDIEDDANVLFEYLLYIGGPPLPKNAADMSASDFVSPHAELRRKAVNDREVLAQSQFADIVFSETNNQLSRAPDGSGEIRHCQLRGTCFDSPFFVEFDVHEPSLLVDNLTLDVRVEMQLKVGAVLEQIKDECNLLAFFRLFVHYARLDHERKKAFGMLKEHFANTSITVVELDEERLKFMRAEKNDEPELLLSWVPRAVDGYHDDLDVTICDRVRPDLRLEADLPDTWKPTDDEQAAFNDLPEKFSQLVISKGVLQATHIMVNVILQ